MSDDEAAAQIVQTQDLESDHRKADGVLLQLLMQLGYTKTVDAFNSLDKWYGGDE